MMTPPGRVTPPSNPALMIATAAFLEQGRILDRLSRLLTAAALILLPLLALLAPQMRSETWNVVAGALGLAIALGLAELYFAFRVGFDAALFRELAAGSALTGLDQLDASLTWLGLRPKTAGSRPLDDRIGGARQLLRRQALCLALQLATMVVAAGILALQ